MTLDKGFRITSQQQCAELNKKVQCKIGLCSCTFLFFECTRSNVIDVICSNLHKTQRNICQDQTNKKTVTSLKVLRGTFSQLEPGIKKLPFELKPLKSRVGSQTFDQNASSFHIFSVLVAVDQFWILFIIKYLCNWDLLWQNCTFRLNFALKFL